MPRDFRGVKTGKVPSAEKNPTFILLFGQMGPKSRTKKPHRAHFPQEVPPETHGLQSETIGLPDRSRSIAVALSRDFGDPRETGQDRIAVKLQRPFPHGLLLLEDNLGHSGQHKPVFGDDFLL